MKPNDDINKEINELSPFLATLKEEKEGYTVPQDYFSALPEEIMDKCVKETRIQNSTKISIWDQMAAYLETILQARLALAFASIALIVVAAVFFFPRENNVAFAQELFTEEEALAYINENIEDFDLELLEEDFEGEINFSDVFDINEESLNQYIEDNVLEDLDETTLEKLL